jgi:predicted HicB family RNase H-like nuclease
MKGKLTLTIDKKIIEQSKKYAASQNRSLSDLVQSYLRAITQNLMTSYPVTDRVRIFGVI